jgi:hypothetical protein
LTVGGNCSRFTARDVSFGSNAPSYYYQKDPQKPWDGVRMAGFSQWVHILEPSVGSGVYTQPPYTDQSCNSLHTYDGGEELGGRWNFARGAGAVRGEGWAPVGTPRFPPLRGGPPSAASVAAAGTEWEGRAVYNWTAAAAAGSALLASVDLATAPSLAGRAVYVALNARRPPGLMLTLAIDPGDGVFDYSDGGGDSSQPGAADPDCAWEPPAAGAGRACEWETHSYQAMLYRHGTARVAMFMWRRGPGAPGAAVQLVGPVAVAAVGTRFAALGGVHIAASDRSRAADGELGGAPRPQKTDDTAAPPTAAHKATGIVLLPKSPASRQQPALIRPGDGYMVSGDGGRQSLSSSATNSWSLTSFNGSVTTPATVPGQVHLDLERAGVINSTYALNNQDANAWVMVDSWSFALKFSLDKTLASAENIWLVFDGVDTVGRVHLNERVPPNNWSAWGPLLKHGAREFVDLPAGVPGLPLEDMYLRYAYDVSAAIKRTGTNSLVVQIASVAPLDRGAGRTNQPYSGHPGFNTGSWRYVRKEPSQFGWEPLLPRIGPPRTGLGGRGPRKMHHFESCSDPLKVFLGPKHHIYITGEICRGPR